MFLLFSINNIYYHLSDIIVTFISLFFNNSSNHHKKQPQVMIKLLALFNNQPWSIIFPDNFY